MRRVGPLALGQQLESVADHAGAGDLAESADVRQARRAVARFEYNGLFLAVLYLLQPLDKTTRLPRRARPSRPARAEVGAGTGDDIAYCFLCLEEVAGVETKWREPYVRAGAYVNVIASERAP